MTKGTRPRDYSKGKIYKLECLTSGQVYIGSTTKQYLSQRLTAHVSDYKRWLNDKFRNVSSFEIIGNGNYQITLLEAYPCKSEDELKARERHWIESTTNVNRHIPTRTKAEWYEANVERIAEQKKQYRQDNAERLAERDKRYYQANIERITERQKTYRQANAERIAEKIQCPCGAEMRRDSIRRHERSKKHQEFLV